MYLGVRSFFSFLSCWLHRVVLWISMWVLLLQIRTHSIWYVTLKKTQLLSLLLLLWWLIFTYNRASGKGGRLPSFLSSLFMCRFFRLQNFLCVFVCLSWVWIVCKTLRSFVVVAAAFVGLNVWMVKLPRKKTCWWAFFCEFCGMVLRERWIQALKCSALLLAAARQQSVSSNFVALELFETQRL